MNVDVNGDTEYEIDAILDWRISDDHLLVKYLVKFTGWDEPEWVPEENFHSYDMLYAYECEHPMNPNRAVPGYRAFTNSIKRRMSKRNVAPHSENFVAPKKAQPQRTKSAKANTRKNKTECKIRHKGQLAELARNNL